MLDFGMVWKIWTTHTSRFFNLYRGIDLTRQIKLKLAAPRFEVNPANLFFITV